MLTNRENDRLHDVKMAPEMYASGENAASFHRVHGGLTVNQSNRDFATVGIVRLLSVDFVGGIFVFIHNATFSVLFHLSCLSFRLYAGIAEDSLQ